MTPLIVDVEWGEERTQRNWQHLIARRSARRRQRALLMLLALVGAGALWLSRPAEVKFADGSTAQLLDDASRVERGGDERSALLLSGRARFEVTHDAAHRFRVQAGDVTVEVLGTRFVVERWGARTKVSVERGRVRVQFADGARELHAGESGLFPPDDPVKAWLDAADRARLAGRPTEAVAPLQHITASYPKDPRAPLAAFTLGRIYLELGNPSDAADAFAHARALSPNGPLAADALAREKKARR
jgi:hypothetical protein